MNLQSLVIFISLSIYFLIKLHAANQVRFIFKVLLLSMFTETDGHLMSNVFLTDQQPKADAEILLKENTFRLNLHVK